MAVRAAGVRLEMQRLAEYLNGGRQVDDANKKIKGSLDSLAEADRRATIAARGAAQQRGAVARAESQERIAAAKATSARVIEEERRATATLRAELAQRAAVQRQAATPTGGGAGALGGIGRSALGFGLGLLGIQGAQQALGTTIELDRMAAQSRTTNIALTALAGGSGQAAEAIRLIQSVAPGSTNALEAAGAAATIMTQKLNSSAVGIDEIAKAIAIIPQLSPSIKSTGDALAQLTLFSSSAAFARADQLLVTADAVKQRIQELQVAYPGLTDAQAKAAATVQLVNENFKAVGDSLSQNIPGIQKLTTAFEDLKLAIATGGIAPVDNFFSGIASGINSMKVALGGGTLQARDTALQDLRHDLEQQLTASQQNFSFDKLFGGDAGGGEFNRQLQRIDVLANSVKGANELAATGAPAALEYQKALQGVLAEVVNQHQFSPELAASLAEVRGEYLETARAAETYAAAQQKAAQAAATIAEATNLAELNEVRGQIDELTKSSLDLFAQGAPGAGELSSALIELQTHLAGSTQLSEEDAAAVQEAAKQHQLLAAAAGQSVGGLDAAAQAKLNDQVAALQDAQANQVLAASLQAVAAAQAGVARGIVGDLSGLIGKGTISSGQAGALDTLLQSQASAQFSRLPAGLSPNQAAFAQAQIQRDTSGAFVAELLEIETSMTKEAQKQHQAAQASSKEWNSAQKDAEKAAAAQRKLVEKIEGLLSPSKVTEQQMAIAKAGGEVNLPDNFLRRFRDVAENGVQRDDFGEEQLAEARTALERIGVKPLEDIKGFFAQFDQAWEDKSLFSDKANLELFDKAAIDAQKSLIEKQEQGLKNIYEFMGVKIDETVAGATGGGGVPPIDQEALQARIDAAVKRKIEDGLMAAGFGPGGTADTSLATVVTGAGGGATGKSGGLQEAFSGVFGTADILRGSLENVTTTADILREAFGRVGDSADTFKDKQDAIPQLVWQGEEGVIDTFPAWQGKEGIIDPFPGWEAWLGAEKVDTGPADIGASGTTGSNTVPGGLTSPVVPDIIRESMTQPSSNTTNNTRSMNVTINTNQSTGSIVHDMAIVYGQAGV